MENKFVLFYDKKYPLSRVRTVRSLLTTVFGVGVGSVLQLAASAGLSPSSRVEVVPTFKLNRLAELVDSLLLVGRPLKKLYITRIAEKKRVGSYVGLRHLQRLPTRGQRTHSNGRTARRVSFIF